MNKYETNSKPRRAQGGKGLLSLSISVQNPQESMPLIPREEREEEREEEDARREGRSVLASRKRQKERKRGRGGI